VADDTAATAADIHTSEPQWGDGFEIETLINTRVLPGKGAQPAVEQQEPCAHDTDGRPRAVQLV
jgi:hypothetical protein